MQRTNGGTCDVGFLYQYQFPVDMILPHTTGMNVVSVDILLLLHYRETSALLAVGEAYPPLTEP